MFRSPNFAPLKFRSTLTCPIQLRLFNGSITRLITQVIDQQFHFEDDTTYTERFYVTQLHTDAKVVLGLSWLQKHNPDIDWSTLSMRFRNSDTRSLTIKPLPTMATDAARPAGSYDPTTDELRVLRELAPKDWSTLR